MKFTTKQKIDPALFNERKIKEYSYINSTPGSDDGMRRGYSYTVHCKVYAEITNETQNEDGTYSYDYISRVEQDADKNDEGYRKPEESKADLENIIYELMFIYNIHEFTTELQDKPNSIKDYYAELSATAFYKKGKDPNLIYNTDKIEFHKKEDKRYKEFDNNSLLADNGWIKSSSAEELNKKVNEELSTQKYFSYLRGDEVKRTYGILLDLDEMEENQDIKKFLQKVKIQNPLISDLELALEKGLITIEDIKNIIRESKYYSATGISTKVFEQIFSEEPELIHNFSGENMPIDILRKYNPEYDVTKIKVEDLMPIDLDNVLKRIINSSWLSSYYEEDRKKISEYMQYLATFRDNPEALKKIIYALSTTPNTSFRDESIEFINQIALENLEPKEVREILLNAQNIPVRQLIGYKISYDEKSSRRLLEILGNTKKVTDLKDINYIISILKQNGISDEEILQALRENEFNISNSYKQEETFKNYKIKGITLNDFKQNIQNNKKFNILTLLEEINSEDATKLYREILNKMAVEKGKDAKNNTKKYEEIFDLMCNYECSYLLLSNLMPEIKELTKGIVIDNLDLIEELQGHPFGKSSQLSRFMDIISKSFDISEDDLETIYIKCLNNGAQKEDLIPMLTRYLQQERKTAFIERINKANIYPNPKYFWLTDKLIKRISIIGRKLDRNAIKNIIQKDGKCFSIRLKTDMVGKSKEGQKITVNNLSKWLFGVPEAKGNLYVTRSGFDIQLPCNTPDEAIKLIEGLLSQQSHDER